MKCANKNGYSIIRIVQNDIYREKFDWFTVLIQNIQEIIDDGIVQNIFICNNNEYVNYIDIFDNKSSFSQLYILVNQVISSFIEDLLKTINKK